MALGRGTSGVLQLLGIAGLLVCIVLAVGILLGRTWVGIAVGDGFTTVDTTISDGLAGIDDASTRLADAGAALDELIAQLGPLPASSPIPAAVAARITEIVDRVAPARDRYVDARGEAQAALRYLELVRRAAPGFEIPPGMSTALATADERRAAIDAALVTLRGAARASAGDVAAAATAMRQAVMGAADAGTTLRGEVDGLRTSMVDIHASIDRVLWLGTAALLAIVGYVGLLNLLLIWLARRARRGAVVAPGAGAIEATPGS